ncbi:Zn-dependent hydrolase, partial [Pseudomonas aeruginosa]|nr:Zn-dependent hydrolase [Pseudomonas aeruginosa]
NALLGAARLVERIDAIALAHGPLGVGTVGLMEVKPNSRNVIPGTVFFCVDLRHPDDATVEKMDAQFRQALVEVCAEIGLEHEL